MTALLITVSLEGQEAVRVGYYIHNMARRPNGKEYTEHEQYSMTVE